MDFRRAEVTRNVILRGLAPAAAGGVLGLTLAGLFLQAFRSLLYESEPLDVTSFVLGALVLLFVAVIAAWIPARRAATVDPVTALRAE